MSALEIQDTFQPYYSGGDTGQPVTRKTVRPQVDARDAKPDQRNPDEQVVRQVSQSRPH